MNEGNGIVTTMPVTPTYSGYGNGGFGGFGGDGWWIILLLLFAGGGWGNGFGGFGGGDLYPASRLYDDNLVPDQFADTVGVFAPKTYISHVQNKHNTGRD